MVDPPAPAAGVAALVVAVGGDDLAGPETARLIVPEPNTGRSCSGTVSCWAHPNHLWQIDATHWTLADGRRVEIINVIDDHSPLCVASVAVRSCTTEAAWETVTGAAVTWALPTRMLSDNGLSLKRP